MKVTFIAPKLKYGLWNIRFFRYPPLGLVLLASITPQDWQVEIIDENIQKVNYDQTDLAAISTTTPTANRAYQIARAYRSRGIKVILGGIHPSMMPKEASQYADSVVIGEADLVWGQILKDFQKNKLKTIYRANGHPDLSQIPALRKDLLKKRYFSQNIVQASRGCPFGCDFCSVSKFCGRKVRNRPIEDVLKEIKGFRGLFKKIFFFTDDNIVANPHYAKKLFKVIKPLKLSWGSQASITIAQDKKLLKLAAESGCRALFIGFESLSQNSLKEVHKAYPTQEYRKMIKRIQSYKIMIEGAFIFGFDHDQKDVFKKTVDFCHQTNLDIAQFAILTPYPGTKLFQRLKKARRITSSDWEKYDLTHVVFKPKNMTAQELRSGLKWCYQNFYSWRSIVKRVGSSIPKIGLPYSLLLLLVNYDFKKASKLIT